MLFCSAHGAEQFFTGGVKTYCYFHTVRLMLRDEESSEGLRANPEGSIEQYDERDV
jgi:hypothetical protein